MPYCDTCGVRIQTGSTCPKCVATQQTGTQYAASLSLGLYLDPPNLVRGVLAHATLQNSLLLFGTAFALRLIALFISYNHARNTAMMVVLGGAGWMLEYGGWVAALTLLAGKLTQRRPRWEAILAVVGVLVLPAAALSIISALLPARALVITNALSYLPVIILWPGLWLLVQHLTDGATKQAFRLLLSAGAIPAVMELLFSVYRSNVLHM